MLNTRSDFYSKESIDIRAAIKKRGPAKQLAALIRHHLRKISGRTKGTYFKAKLDHYLKKGDRVLDIGCGLGAVIAEIHNNYECCGVEVSAYMAKEVTNMYNIKTFCGDFQSVDFENLRFDGIMMVSLLEHLHNPKDALQKSYNLLNKGGVMLLKTVNHNGLNRRLLGYEL